MIHAIEYCKAEQVQSDLIYDPTGSAHRESDGVPSIM